MDNLKEVWAPPDLLEATRAGVEISLPVVGSNGWYEVSNQGGARTWRKRGAWSIRADQPTPLVCSPNADGYRVLQICDRGSRRIKLLHNAMCEAFIGPRPGPTTVWECGHYDDGRTHNVLTNIRWVTRVVNQKDRKRNGRQVCREARVIDGVPSLRCTKCDTWKSFDEFRNLTAKKSQTKCGKISWCKECCRAWDREKKRAKREAAPAAR